MAEPIPLSTGLGEVMVPGVLMVALVVDPEGTIAVDPGALHGRSRIEQTVRFKPQRGEVSDPQTHWVVFVAVAIDAGQRPVRYQGLSVSELLVDRATGLGYKVLAEQVNRMAEAIRGGVNTKTMPGALRAKVAEELRRLSLPAWERADGDLTGALRA